MHKYISKVSEGTADARCSARYTHTRTHAHTHAGRARTRRHTHAHTPAACTTWPPDTAAGCPALLAQRNHYCAIKCLMLRNYTFTSAGDINRQQRSYCDVIQPIY